MNVTIEIKITNNDTSEQILDTECQTFETAVDTIYSAEKMLNKQVLAEEEKEEVSNCCGAIIHNGLCNECKEHCVAE